MEKYKICPSCGARNLPTLFECIECETDLTAVRAVDTDTASSETIHENPPSAGNMVRICDCGAKNLPSARKCSVCGEDISDIIPVPDTAEQIHFVFASADGEFAFEITETPLIIGREHAMKEYLSSKRYVSRSHAEITLSEGKLFIRNLSQANGSYLNNVKLDDTAHELKDGDEISFGGCIINGNRQADAAYFHVRTGACI